MFSAFSKPLQTVDNALKCTSLNPFNTWSQLWLANQLAEPIHMFRALLHVTLAGHATISPFRILIKTLPDTCTTRWINKTKSLPILFSSSRWNLIVALLFHCKFFLNKTILRIVCVFEHKHLRLLQSFAGLHRPILYFKKIKVRHLGIIFQKKCK